MTTKSDMYMFYFIFNIVVVSFCYIIYFANYIVFYSYFDRVNVKLIITSNKKINNISYEILNTKNIINLIIKLINPL